MPVDLTDFSSLPSQVTNPGSNNSPQQYEPIQSPQPARQAPRSRPQEPASTNKFGLPDHLLDDETRESLTREGRQSEYMKKHLWKPNNFEGWDFDEDSIAEERARRGIPDPDKTFKDAPFIK